MATISQLKTWFSRGVIPTEAQYHAWIDSFFHKNESLPVGQIEGLQGLLDQKQDVANAVTMVFTGISNHIVCNLDNNGDGASILNLEYPANDGDVFQFEMLIAIPIPLDFIVQLRVNAVNTIDITEITVPVTGEGDILLKGTISIINGQLSGFQTQKRSNSLEFSEELVSFYDNSVIEKLQFYLISTTSSSPISFSVRQAFIKKIN